jgi:hypothetical protein
MAAQSSYADTAHRPSAGRLVAPMTRARRFKLAILGAALLCLAALLATSLGPGTRGGPVRAAEGPHRLAVATLLRLPAAARGPISAALGGDQAVYRVAGLRARNPAQRMALRFTRGGVTLSSGRTRLSLALAGVGRGEELLPARPAAPLAASNRVSYTRGALREWYVNGPAGLEQGFDLARRPAGSGALTLAVALSGASSVRVHDGSALLSGPSGTLRYSGLSATDARGRPLRAWLSLSAGRLLIHVEDRKARYPVRIDPFIEQGEPLAGSNEVGEGAFGYSVALSADGNTALIGGPGDNNSEGAAWVFTRAGGVWTQQGAKLTATEENGQGGFGSSVALSEDGNTALIGGTRDDNDIGAVWVFTRSGGGWTQQTKLTDGEPGFGFFGASVALSGDGNTALVGSPGVRSGAGASWIFTRSGETWTQNETPLVGGDETGEGEAGASVALSRDGNTALIGVPGDSTGHGAAWIFTHSGGGWAQQGQKLFTAGSQPSQFGASVALSAEGNTALIGAPDDLGDDGAAFAFARSAGVWQQQGSPLDRGFDGEEHLGVSVALSADGNIAVLSGVGASGVWEYERYGEDWLQSESVAATDSGNVALSATAGTVLLGGGATYGNVGTALVLVEVPSITFVDPTSGPTSGGTKVAINGTGFEGATAVMFGSTPASFTVDSPREITAVTPPGSAGEVEIKVANAAGSSPGRAVFTYGTPPAPPTDVHASAGDGEAKVTFTAPSPAEERDESSFTVTASPGGAQTTGSFSRAIAVKGLKNGVRYTFTVTATDQFGTGPPSAASNAVVPGQIVLGRATGRADGSVVLVVQVPGAGVLSANQAIAPKGGARKASVRHGSKRAHGHKPQSYGGSQSTLVEAVRDTIFNEQETATLTLRPTAAAFRELARRGKLTVPVQVAFAPEGGEPTSTAATNVGLVRPGYSFEAGIEGWEQAWGNLTLAGNAAHHHTGTHSLQITMRSDPYSAVNATANSSASLGRVGLLPPGVAISMWVYRPVATPPVGFRAMVRVGGEWTECRSAEVRPRANRWVRLSIAVPSSANCKGSGGAKPVVDAVGVEVDDKGDVASGKSVYLDDVSW